MEAIWLGFWVGVLALSLYGRSRPQPSQAALAEPAPEPEPAAVAPESIGPYEVLGLLGLGGMATVYRARDTRNQRTVALKVVLPEMQEDPEFLLRFQREIEISRLLQHVNLVEVLEAGAIGGRLCMAMEVVEGQSLADLLTGGPLPLAQFGRLAGQLASGLHFAHQRDLCHRDVKPANIVVSEGDVVKIVDFGLAIEAGQNRLTTVGFAMGTPAYMAPETFTGGLGDSLSDQYSLGVVFYEMLTGRIPFAGDTMMEIARGHVKQPVTPPTSFRPDLPPPWEQTIMRMLSKKPADRFPDLEAVSRTLTVNSCHHEHEFAR